MISWQALGTFLEIVGGAKPLPEAWKASDRVAAARAVWWLFLFLLAAAFAGRQTKFVYVDF